MLTAVSVTPAQAQRYLNGGALTISRCRAPKIAMPEGTQVALATKTARSSWDSPARKTGNSNTLSHFQKNERESAHARHSQYGRNTKVHRREKTAVALGAFDGLHIGHYKVIRTAVESGLTPVVFTFRDNPRSTLQVPAAISPPLRSACAF